MSAYLPPSPRLSEPFFALLRFHAVAGAILGVVFVAGVLAFDLAHIRTLAFSSEDGVLAIAMLTIGSIITFSSVVMGSAIMTMTDKDDPPKGGHRQKRGETLIPVPVRVSQRTRFK